MVFYWLRKQVWFDKMMCENELCRVWIQDRVSSESKLYVENYNMKNIYSVNLADPLLQVLVEFSQGIILVVLVVLNTFCPTQDGI